MAKQEIGMTTTQGFIDPTVKTYTPLLSEVLTKVNNAKNKAQKVKILKEHDCLPLRQILIWAFDPNTSFVLVCFSKLQAELFNIFTSNLWV